MPLFSCNGFSSAAISTVNVDGQTVRRDLFDLNGDGLPDVVQSCSGDANWHVFLGQGSGFAEEQLWASPRSYIRDSGNEPSRDVIDMDGDGLPDLVDTGVWTTQPMIYHNAGGAWCASRDEITCADPGQPDPLGEVQKVAANRNSGRPDLLVRMENGVGGATTLEYRPSTQWNNTGGDRITDLPFNVWTVTRIESNDGMCDEQEGTCATDGSHKLVTNIRYQNGRFDTAEREFRGFQLVWSEDADPPELHLVTQTWFLQDAYRKGKVLQVATYEGGHENDSAYPLGSKINTWGCADPDSGTGISCPAQLGEPLVVRLAATFEKAYSNYNPYSGHFIFTSNPGWDLCDDGHYYGNLTHTFTFGDNTSEVDTHTWYTCSSSTHIVDRPTRVQTKGPDGNGAPDSVTLEDKWFSYDGMGNVTTVKSLIDHPTDGAPHGDKLQSCPSGGGQCVVTEMTYDSFGNVVDVTESSPFLVENLHGSLTITQPRVFC